MFPSARKCWPSSDRRRMPCRSRSAPRTDGEVSFPCITRMIRALWHRSTRHHGGPCSIGDQHLRYQRGVQGAAKRRILTGGHRPTGPRRLGHLVGTLDTWQQLQDDHECLFLVADLHVLTTDYVHPQRIRTNVQAVLLDWLGAGRTWLA
ncbi:TPA: hypothetical protein DCY67_02955 [Candidatus Acetothermia bacterium]|nr:hypothetical protein [Candidatus Acetothermia bacterium]